MLMTCHGSQESSAHRQKNDRTFVVRRQGILYFWSSVLYTIPTKALATNRIFLDKIDQSRLRIMASKKEIESVQCFGRKKNAVAVGTLKLYRFISRRCHQKECGKVSASFLSLSRSRDAEIPCVRKSDIIQNTF